MKSTRFVRTLCVLALGLMGSRGIVAQTADARLQQRLNSLEAGIRAEEAVRAVKRPPWSSR